ncbi:Very-long-chain enoyl-CoA reductase, partial [Eudyptes moseleyi]
VLFFEVEILDARTREKLCFLDKVEPNATIAEIKSLFTKTHPQWYPARQSLRLDPKGRSLKDEDVLQSLPVGTTATFYFRDLGAQISWVTVFLTEYAGPLLIYLLFYFRVPFLYGPRYDFTASRHPVVHLACGCHSFHYIKRLLETLFVHRFSHGTMPLRNIFKCHCHCPRPHHINHLLYTPSPVSVTVPVICPPLPQPPAVHPPGERHCPRPCPLYLSPSHQPPTVHPCPFVPPVGTLRGGGGVMALFSLVGFVQMAIWAQGKHRSYLREFRDYPPLRSPIVPFLL